MHTTIAALPNLVRVAREHRGMTQMELAYRSGITQQTLYHVEHAKRKTKMTTRKSVAMELGFTVKELWPAPGERSSAAELRGAGKVGR